MVGIIGIGPGYFGIILLDGVAEIVGQIKLTVIKVSLKIPRVPIARIDCILDITIGGGVDFSL